MNYKNVLAISPHADDVELGCGATLTRLLQQGAKITSLVFSYPPKVELAIIKEEHNQAMHMLGIKDVIVINGDPQRLQPEFVRNAMYQLNKQSDFDLVLIPNSKDTHQSHEVVHREAKRVFKHTTLLGYELPWNSFGFDNDCYFEVDEDNLFYKLAAIKCYQSQMARPFFGSPVASELARLRGSQINKPLAECFEVIRIVNTLR